MTLLNQLENGQAKEPAVKTGALTGTVAGLLSLVLYFAPDLLTDKQLAMVAVVGAFLLPVVSAVITRGKVWSPASVKEVVDEAVATAIAEIKKQQQDKQLAAVNAPRVINTNEDLDDDIF